MSGTRTGTGGVAIHCISADKGQQTLYDLQGRKVEGQHRRGIYVTKSKKLVMK
jgi:hypothetical protein